MATLTPGRDGNYFKVTGTTGIDEIASLGKGMIIYLHFEDILTITHHATNLILPNAEDIATFAGLVLGFIEYDTAKWRMMTDNDIQGTVAGGGTGTTTSPSGAISGTFLNLVIQNTSGQEDDQVDVNADEGIARDVNGVGTKLTAIDLTLNNAGIAALNGFDTGTVEADTWYYMWIWNGTGGTCGILSKSNVLATVQSRVAVIDATYATYGVVAGEIRVNASLNFERILKKGDRTQYTTIGTNQRVAYSAGDVGNPMTPTWVAAQVRSGTHPTGASVPPTAKIIYGYIVGNTDINNVRWAVVPNNNYGAVGSFTNPPVIGGYNILGGTYFSFVLESNNIYWALTFSSPNGAAIFIHGWE